MPPIIPTETVPFTITIDNWMQYGKLEELRLADSERGSLMDADDENDYFVRYRERVDGLSEPIVDNYQWVWGNEDGADGSEDDSMPNNVPPLRPDSLDQGFNAQDFLFWEWLQVDIEYFCLNRYTYPEVPADLSSIFSGGSWSLQFPSFEAFCEYCGGTLYTSSEDYGLRRGILDVDGNLVMTRSTGSVELPFAGAGDVLGFWLVEDLILAYNNLTHCYNASPSSWIDGGKITSEGLYGGIVIETEYLATEGEDTTFTLNGSVKDVYNNGNYTEWFLVIWDADIEYFVQYRFFNVNNTKQEIQG